MCDQRVRGHVRLAKRAGQQALLTRAAAPEHPRKWPCYAGSVVLCSPAGTACFSGVESETPGPRSYFITAIWPFRLGILEAASELFLSTPL